MIGKPRMTSWFQTPDERDSERDVAALETPPAQHRERHRDAGRGATRRDVRGGRRRLRADERLTEAKAGKRDHPRRRVRRKIEDHGAGKGEKLLPREHRDNAPDVAVVRDSREHEGEDAADDHDRRSSAEDRATVLTPLRVDLAARFVSPASARPAERAGPPGSTAPAGGGRGARASGAPTVVTCTRLPRRAARTSTVARGECHQEVTSTSSAAAEARATSAIAAALPAVWRESVSVTSSTAAPCHARAISSASGSTPGCRDHPDRTTRSPSRAIAHARATRAEQTGSSRLLRLGE